MYYFISLFSFCWFSVCASPTPTVPTKIDIQRSVSAPAKAKQGEKVWVTLNGFKKERIVSIKFGDGAFTEPVADKNGFVKTWHTYGCVNDADFSDYIITISQKDSANLVSKLRIVCRELSPTPVKVSIIASVTSTPTPTRTKLPTRLPSPSKPTLQATRNPTQVVTKAITPTQVNLSEKKVAAENNPCKSLHVVVSTSLYGRITTIPYTIGPINQMPVYDVGAVSADQMFEYKIRFSPSRVRYQQDGVNGNNKTYDLKIDKKWRDHFYLQGFYSANSKLMSSRSVEVVSDDTITQIAYVPNRITIEAKTKQGVNCGIVFKQTYDAPATSSAYDSSLTQEGNKPKKYQLQ